MTLPLRFKPVSHSWLALHPNPRGIVQFVGGAFFGTFAPMLFYRHLLQHFFDQSYTIILLPFNFTFDHYREAGFLVREQYRILPELVRMAISEKYEYQVYLKDSNYYWAGHSIGCKYVSLLEGFSALPESKEASAKFIRDLFTNISEESYSETAIQRVIAEIHTLVEIIKQESATAQNLIHLYIKEGDESKYVDSKSMSIFANLFINNQPSILLAPCTSDTSSAIRPKALARLVDRWGLGVQPTPAVTRALIQKSNLFNLLGLVCFQSDTIASETRQWFINKLGKPPQNDQKLLSGGHLRPLGIPSRNLVFNPFFDKPMLTLSSLRNASLESHIDELLESLQKRMNQTK